MLRAQSIHLRRCEKIPLPQLVPVYGRFLVPAPVLSLLSLSTVCGVSRAPLMSIMRLSILAGLGNRKSGEWGRVNG